MNVNKMFFSSAFKFSPVNQHNIFGQHFTSESCIGKKDNYINKRH